VSEDAGIEPRTVAMFQWKLEFPITRPPLIYSMIDYIIFNKKKPEIWCPSRRPVNLFWIRIESRFYWVSESGFGIRNRIQADLPPKPWFQRSGRGFPNITPYLCKSIFSYTNKVSENTADSKQITGQKSRRPLLSKVT